MVNILLSDELESQLKATLPLCKSDVNIITAFCKISTLKMLDSLIKEGLEKEYLFVFYLLILVQVLLIKKYISIAKIIIG